jgi:hypothetical protein
MAQFAGANEYMRGKLHRVLGQPLAVISINRAEQFAHPFGIGYCAVVRYCGRSQRAAQIAGRVGCQPRPGFVSLFFPRWVFACRHQFASIIAPLAGIGQTDFRISADAQLFLSAINAILQSPKFSAGRLD